MFTIVRKEIDWAGKKLVLETGKIARQADGAVVVTYGETTVLCTVVSAKKVKPGVDFFPLTVHYQEKYYAGGRIPGGFFKREGRPTEKETLTARLIDRPIRPLFPEHFYNETQVVCTVLSYDAVNDPDIAALVGTSAALAVSGVPFDGPVGAARVAYTNGQYILNPTLQELPDSALDLVVAGTATSVLMVESEAQELSEEVMLGAVNFGHAGFQPVIELIKAFADEAGKPVREFQAPSYDGLDTRIASLAEAGLQAAFAETGKQARSEKIDAVHSQVVETLSAELGDAFNANLVNSLFKDVEKNIVRGNIVDKGWRIDGRDKAKVRPIIAEVDILPRTHGSALFTRGETQALVVTTLGTSEDEQMIDGLENMRKEGFMLHYNFPPYSVGEATPMRAPGRREIGHGKLAWRALRPLMPTKEQFPYTVRVVSEITESNGSSSMATVCGSSLSMMAAGVPLVRPVAGIAMGLIKEAEKFVVLSDIMGDEDHLGDMDFKVAGTTQGVTALQMDIKIKGITPEIMEIALAQAKEGRIHILGRMDDALTGSREGVNKNAPTITAIKIPKDKIREVIGSGGKVIREICEVSGAKVDIEDDGTIRVAAVNGEASEKALQMIADIVSEPEVGTIYDGKVVRIVDFGAFVGIMGGKQEGLVHVSELANHRVEKVTDILSEGDSVKVKVLEIDPRTKKVRLSYRAVDQATGADISDQIPAKPANTNKGERGERSDRGDRNDRGDRGDRGDRNRDRGDRDRGGDRDRNRRRESFSDNNESSGNAGNNEGSSGSGGSFSEPREEPRSAPKAEEQPKKKRRFF